MYENKIQDYFKMTLAEIQTIMQKLRNLAKTRPVNAESKARKLFTELNKARIGTLSAEQKRKFAMNKQIFLRLLKNPGPK